MHGEMRSTCKILVGTPEGKRPLGRPRNRCESNIAIYLIAIDKRVWTGLIWLSVRTSDRRL
jgi:hypothetical protein